MTSPGFLLLAAVLTGQGSGVGERPYEMVWAGRTADLKPPLVDFEDLEGWRVETTGAVARFERSREQLLWGESVGKLTYRGTGADGRTEVRLIPPRPLEIGAAFDAVTLWIHGNNWSYAPDPGTPGVEVVVLLEDPEGRRIEVPLDRVGWKDWFVSHRRLSEAQAASVRRGARLAAIAVRGGRNTEDRVIYLDNLAVFTEDFPALTFEPRPARGVAMFEGQGAGTNTGPGRLPFPTRIETILPENLTANFRTEVEPDGAGWTFTYRGEDGTLQYRYEPASGTWGDLAAHWQDPDGTAREGPFRPLEGGGIRLIGQGGPAAPERAEHLRTAREGDAVVSRWRVTAQAITADVSYTMRLWGKSLVLDTKATGGLVAEVRYGAAEGLEAPRLVTHPFYPADGGRPAVVVAGTVDRPLFVTGNTDWYRTNASVMWASPEVAEGRAIFQGGTRYTPRTDGTRNDVFERFFLTVTPRFEETLPTVANPVSPWKHVTGTHLWRAHGASDRDRDAAFWRECRRWGMTQVVVTDHETGWRDGGESFTFRTRTAPGRGGDASQDRYARVMQDELGFVYGPYNNFTDFAPVNEFWSFDLISRTPENQFQRAWARCYAPKPSRAVEFCARLAPEIEKKFHFSTAYCDVHTAVAPWDRVDYDARVPGAGTMAAVYYAYGEIMLLQKAAWDGPVYSEGNHHAFYCGLTDGNYGQDQAYRPALNPWLVDFDLRKLHDLGCNFGMGNLDMFYANRLPPHETREQRDAMLDRFLAATVAFGHPGFLAYEPAGLSSALRSYYMLQQLHSRYCLWSPVEIRYADESGRLLDTSAAVASGAHARSQVVTRYADGTVTAANGHPTQRLRISDAFGRSIDLPANGYAGWAADGTIDVRSADVRGHRFDQAVTPAYLYVDGRGHFTRGEKVAGNGIGIVRFLEGATAEVLIHDGAECGFALGATRAVALDREEKTLGEAGLRTARGLLYVLPVPGAFSYRLEGVVGASPAALRCDRDEVVPGETVLVQGREAHTFRVPEEVRPGTRLWQSFEGAWIDFTVVALAETSVRVDGDELRVGLLSQAPAAGDFVVRAVAPPQSVRLEPGAGGELVFDLGKPTEEAAEIVAVEIAQGTLRQRSEIGLRTERGIVAVADWPEAWQAGLRLRGQAGERSDLSGTGAIATARRVSCGGEGRDAVFMHPPYIGGVGETFARFGPFRLPAEVPASLRASVGKEDGSDPGDGVTYRIVVMAPDGTRTVAAEQVVARHEWLSIEADLGRWAGQEVRLELVTDVGPAGNSSGDWGCWSGLRIESREPVLRRRIEPQIERCRTEPGPLPASDPLTVERLRSARRGRVHYEGKGLEGAGRYGKLAVLNGVELGTLAAAPGDEQNGRYAGVTIALSPQAIERLERHSRLVVRNPGGDSFSLRRVWIELEWEDGQRAASLVSTASWTQPTGWPHAEGILVPAGEPIAVDVWFRP